MQSRGVPDRNVIGKVTKPVNKYEIVSDMYVSFQETKY
jgi:hypothetical protein